MLGRKTTNNSTATPPEDKPEKPEDRPEKKGWFSRLKSGLGLSRDKIEHGIDAVVAAGDAVEPVAEKTLTVEETPAVDEPPAAAAIAPVPEPSPEISAAPEPSEAKVDLPPEPPAPSETRTPETAKPGLAARLMRAVRRRKLDDAALEELEDVLISADLGPATAARLVGDLAKTKFEAEMSGEEIRTALAANITEILAPVARPLDIDGAAKPHVILVAGVNGTGKTTTIAKLGKMFMADGRKVMLCAGDTFRAAAIDQLKIWGERIGAPVVAREQGSDSAGLAYDALERARADGADVLLIDTAGRLHNRADLMAELEKIIRVIKKLDPTAPQSCLLVLDATTGQNAHAQVETFRDMVNITGLIVTKLDGSARGGVLVALADRFGLPVHAIGIGEGVDDLRPFDAGDFARGLMGLA